MSVFVVDPSVVVKWFVPEIHSDAALRNVPVVSDHIQLVHAFDA